ncbi:hypothetical protein [Streptococcus agalactiae]|uniref:hypothetical protein n=1 Tax=Streptococcus agalactiae TaxID=1311 RepID=UPI0005E1DB27|nr:hypothetical protein [Streptococcus agalactiae]CQJ54358.1 phage protein [Streptococcus agalactiae]
MCLLKQIITHKVLSTFIVYIQASFLPEEAYNMQKEKIDNLAETLGCDVVVIEASYDLKFIDGEDVPELTKEQKIKSIVNGMFEQVFGGE